MGVFNPVERFDIVTFRINEKIILKRIVGIPNDTLIYKDGLVIVKLKNQRKKIRLNNWHYRYLSTLSDSILVIPNNKYLLLGDNLENSNDSRDLGFIDINDIHGKCIFSFQCFTTIKDPGFQQSCVSIGAFLSLMAFNCVRCVVCGLPLIWFQSAPMVFSGFWANTSVTLFSNSRSARGVVQHSCSTFLVSLSGKQCYIF